MPHADHTYPSLSVDTSVSTDWIPRNRHMDAKRASKPPVSVAAIRNPAKKKIWKDSQQPARPFRRRADAAAVHPESDSDRTRCLQYTKTQQRMHLQFSGESLLGVVNAGHRSN